MPRTVFASPPDIRPEIPPQRFERFDSAPERPSGRLFRAPGGRQVLLNARMLNGVAAF